MGEIRHILSEKRMNIRELHKKLRLMGSNWRRLDQVRIRLVYLKMLGAVEMKGTKYEWVGVTPSHDELKESLVELGRLLGYASVSEYPVGTSRLDVIWPRDETSDSMVNYAFEVQVGGNLKSALLNLQECLGRWDTRAYVIVGSADIDNARNAIASLPAPYNKKITVLTVNELDEIKRLASSALS